MSVGKYLRNIGNLRVTGGDWAFERSAKIDIQPQNSDLAKESYGRTFISASKSAVVSFMNFFSFE